MRTTSKELAPNTGLFFRKDYTAYNDTHVKRKELKMNIRDAIAAGDMPNETVITTTVGETSEYGRACNLAGKANGYRHGFSKGIAVGCGLTVAGVLAGLLTSIVAEVIIENRKNAEK